MDTYKQTSGENMVNYQNGKHYETQKHVCCWPAYMHRGVTDYMRQLTLQRHYIKQLWSALELYLTG